MEIIPLNLIFHFESAIKEFGPKCAVIERPSLIGLETDSFRASRKIHKIIRALLKFAKPIFVLDPLCSFSHHGMRHALGGDAERVKFYFAFESGVAENFDVIIYTFPKGGRFSELPEIVECYDEILNIHGKKTLMIKLDVNYL